MKSRNRGSVGPKGRAGGGRTDDRWARLLAQVGASLGVLAGLLELTLGPSMRDWVGNKQDTTRLGLTTAILSAVALTAAAALRRGRMGDHRIGLALAWLIPALVCFTTVGRLWYLPGALLLAAGTLVLARTRRQEFATILDDQKWRTGLLLLCGAYYIFLGATALGVNGILGVLGGTLIWAAARSAPRSPPQAYAALLMGALPLAGATWWSVITPLIAVLSLVIGRSVIHHARPVAAHDPIAVLT